MAKAHRFIRHIIFSNSLKARLLLTQFLNSIVADQIICLHFSDLQKLKYLRSYIHSFLIEFAGYLVHHRYYMRCVLKIEQMGVQTEKDFP